MKPKAENDLIDVTINWVREHGHTNGSTNVEITRDTNLLATGLLDSFGFVELILFLENQSGCKIDLTDLDPSEFSVVKGLCGIALRNHH